MPKYEATIKAMKAGAKSLTVNAAVKNIEGWEAALADVDAPGAKGIAGDLGRLKKHLQADTLDGEAIRALVVKLGQATVKIAGHAEGPSGDKIRELGEALTQGAEDADAEA